MRNLAHLLALATLTACAVVDDKDASDTDEDTDGPVDSDSDGSDDTEGTVGDDTDTDTEGPAEVAWVRFHGVSGDPNVDDRLAFTARLDGEPISEGFDAGVLGSATGWFFPGQDALAVPVGEHEVTLDMTVRFLPCPGCGYEEQSTSARLDLDLAADEEVFVVLWSGSRGRMGPYAAIWTVDDTRARVGNGGVRLVGGPPTAPGDVDPDPAQVWSAFGGCVRQPPQSSTLRATSLLMPTPDADDAEAWIGVEPANRFGPTVTSWVRLIDRPAGEVLPVFYGGAPMRVPPQTEGPGVALQSGEMAWADCPTGPS